MGRDARVDLRMEPALKEWFRTYTAHRGGMSRVIHELIADLFEHEEGHPWWGAVDNAADHTDKESSSK